MSHDNETSALFHVEASRRFRLLMWKMSSYHRYVMWMRPDGGPIEASICGLRVMIGVGDLVKVEDCILTSGAPEGLYGEAAARANAFALLKQAGYQPGMTAEETRRKIIAARCPDPETKSEVSALRRQLEIQRANNERRNRQLDALGLVWCSGGCESGMLRFHPDREVTAQMVAELITNARRAATWYINQAGKAAGPEGREAAWKAAREEIRSLLAPLHRDDEALAQPRKEGSDVE